MARNTRLLLQSLKIDKAMIVGHSMGGMLAARFATQYPDVTERLVLYNPIGLRPRPARSSHNAAVAFVRMVIKAAARRHGQPWHRQTHRMW